MTELLRVLALAARRSGFSLKWSRVHPAAPRPQSSLSSHRAERNTRFEPAPLAPPSTHGHLRPFMRLEAFNHNMDEGSSFTCRGAQLRISSF